MRAVLPFMRMLRSSVCVNNCARPQAYAHIGGNDSRALPRDGWRRSHLCARGKFQRRLLV